MPYAAALVLGLAAAFFCGSVPTAYVWGRRLKGIDIREHGSGNVGATNAFRVLGRGAGLAVLAIDVLKGLVAVVGIAAILGLSDTLGRVLLGTAAVAGHNWTPFLGFRGGKGIATSLGVLIGLALLTPGLGGVLAGVTILWAAVFAVSGYVSLASITAAFGLPFLMAAAGLDPVLLGLGVLFCIFVLVRHRPNIHRLRAGRESRVRLPWFRRS